MFYGATWEFNHINVLQDKQFGDFAFYEEFSEQIKLQKVHEMITLKQMILPPLKCRAEGIILCHHWSLQFNLVW